MPLETVPESLMNTTNEHCFESCLGMTLAHYNKLGNLGLKDIIAAVSDPNEKFTPMAKTFDWLQRFGLEIEYIEQEDEKNTEFFSTLRAVGVAIRSVSPTTATAVHLASEGKALFTQMNYEKDEGQDNYELNHTVFLSEDDETGVMVIDPDGMEFSTANLEGFWGRYPNLISVDLK